MVCTFSHDALEVRGEDAVATVEVTHPVRRVGFVCASGRFDPRNPSLSSVEGVEGVRDVTQIGEPVIRRVAVDMVDDLRHFAVSEPPSKPLAGIHPVPVSDADVPRRMNKTGFCARSSAPIAGQPDKLPAFGSVLKLLSNLLWWLHTPIVTQQGGVSIDTYA